MEVSIVWSLLAASLSLLLGWTSCKPGSLTVEHSPRSKHPPICMVKNGSEILCDRSPNCPYFTTCGEGYHEEEGGLDIYLCKPEVCLIKKDGRVIQKSVCMADLRCVEAIGVDDQSVGTVVKVCLPLYIWEQASPDESREVRRFCHMPQLPPICRITDGVRNICDRSSNCPWFTTCNETQQKPPFSHMAGIISTCRPKECSLDAQCSDGLVCKKMNNRINATRSCLPESPENDITKDEDPGLFC